MPDRSPVQLDARDCAAIRDEIGYRLRQYLARDAAPAPSRINKLLSQMRERDADGTSSIAGSADYDHAGRYSRH